MRKIANIVFVTLFLSGCGNTGAPSCTDGNVTESVIEIVKKEVRKNVSGLFSMPIIGALMRDPNLSKKFINLDMNDPYALLNAYKSEDKSAEDVINVIDDAISKIKMDVTGIRINSMNDKIKKSECEGNIETSVGTINNVEYIAQYTEDDQIYVNINSVIKQSITEISRKVIIDITESLEKIKKTSTHQQGKTTPEPPIEVASQPKSETPITPAPVEPQIDPAVSTTSEPLEKSEPKTTSKEQDELSRFKAKDAFDEADKQLNIIWNKLSKTAQKKLLPSQREWLKKRDGDCNLKATSKEPNNTILQDAVRFDCMAEMTNERTYEIGKDEIGVLPGD